MQVTPGASKSWEPTVCPEESADFSRPVQNSARLCPDCNCTLQKPARGPWPRRCQACRYAVGPSNCLQCGEPVAERCGVRGPKPKYCSTRCRNRASTARHPDRVAARTAKWVAQKRAEKRVLTCRFCGDEYETARSRSRCCAKPICLKAAERDCTSTHGRRRRKLKAAGGERISRRAIYERDKWMCQLCRKPIDVALKAPDPGSASLDHVIPLARGGKHSAANLQAAHLRCNLRKSANVRTSQLRLV